MPSEMPRVNSRERRTQGLILLVLLSIAVIVHSLHLSGRLVPWALLLAAVLVGVAQQALP